MYGGTSTFRHFTCWYRLQNIRQSCCIQVRQIFLQLGSGQRFLTVHRLDSRQSLPRGNLPLIKVRFALISCAIVDGCLPSFLAILLKVNPWYRPVSIAIRSEQSKCRWLRYMTSPSADSNHAYLTTGSCSYAKLIETFFPIFSFQGTVLIFHSRPVCIQLSAIHCTDNGSTTSNINPLFHPFPPVRHQHK